ncbi:endo-1,4-beta-xylanase [Phormidium sp. CCY1219]|uniref:endo-1,4-beta-xylanase n=1 Tax=Phormidium sp. CCY1219 TaxID=2886104 RepID=UPI002D1F736F|nr:endo-1,4-beta-xylanase [Phormidium sp. CCY1219]MEB3829733.1 endo-1,4-beta-xylanase [Phormidium sp. CCY1219]
MRVKRTLWLLLLLVLATAGILWMGQISQLQDTGESLRSLAATQGISIGAAVPYRPLEENPMYRRVLAREFNMVTLENAMKFGLLSPQPQVYDFSKSDAIVEFALSHEMQVRGHTLVWHRMQPEWLTEGEFTRDEYIDIVRSHIQTVLGRYKSKIAVWDVVNEAIGDDGNFRDTIWLRGIGPEYVEMAFQWAHEVDPDALLFYNDYGGEGRGKKSDAIYNFVKDLRQRGIPIDGVGLQMHIWNVDKFPDPQKVAQNMQRLGELGLEVQITEMDVGLHKGKGTLEEKLASQAKLYGDMLQVCLDASNCEAFVLWGFTDAHSWMRQIEDNPNYPLIFDESFKPKPSYYALQAVLRRNN